MKDVKQIVSQMTLEEKAGMCSGKDFWYLKGVERLGVPSLMVTDGPHGLRKQAGDADHVGLNESVPATCFPTASALAATWNRDLIFQVGEALGEECLAENVAVILGPGTNIKRSPLCGRNFEYFSEDPFLAGEMAANHIAGVQSKGVGTSLKHYVANNQEFRRMTIDAVVDERAMRELYLAAFEKAVKQSQPWTVMCSYNKINGTYASENKKLMRDVLKGEWKHEGLVVTDWGAMNERVKGLAAGVELEMPGTKNGNDQKIVEAVNSGELDEAILDEAVERILTMIFKGEEALAGDHSYSKEAHHELARKVASEGAVLLKNDGDVLPISDNSKIAVIGRFAKSPRFQGGGSSQMNPTQMDTLFDELGKLVGKENLSYADGYSVKGTDVDTTLIDEAVSTAKQADVVVVCAGLTDAYETEGLDRTHMNMPPGHEAVIEAIAEECENVVVVLSNGSPIEMPWVGIVSAVLEGYLGGQAGAGGVADILTGKVNPSGKLAETFPLKLEDNPSHGFFPGGPATVEYRESIYVGYRYYDKANQDVLFPFGFGLSYTKFEYSNLTVSAEEFDAKDGLTVTFDVKNVGKVAGKETAQVYVHDFESTVFKPAKELKGFAKVELAAGETKTVSVALDRRSFAHYETSLSEWVVETGAFEILVGSSSADIHLTASVEVSGDDNLPAARTDIAEYFMAVKAGEISPAVFEKLLGRKAPENTPSKKGEYSLNTPVGDMQDSLIGRQLYKTLQKNMGKMFANEDPDSPMVLLMSAMMKEMPMRTMMMMGGDDVSPNMLLGLLDIMNGKLFKGVGKLLKK